MSSGALRDGIVLFHSQIDDRFVLYQTVLTLPLV